MTSVTRQTPDSVWVKSLPNQIAQALLDAPALLMREHGMAVCDSIVVVAHSAGKSLRHARNALPEGGLRITNIKQRVDAAKSVLVF
jgi:hypothetical protein